MASSYSETISRFLATDDLTILLGLISATVFLVHNLYKPQPLVHPILLGRQSDISRVRNPTESAVYRNYATGLLGRFPVRPDKDTTLVEHLVKSSLDSTRSLWSSKISNPTLKDRASNLATGLVNLAGAQPGESSVLLLLNDSLEFLVSDIALASISVPSLTLSSLDLLSPVLDVHPPSAIIVNAEFLPHLLELIYEASEDAHHTIIVVGSYQASSEQHGAKILNWSDLEAHGKQTDKLVVPAPRPSDVFSVSYYRDSDGALQGAQITHENMTAGVASIRGLFPPSTAISTLDTLVSSYTLSIPYGRAIAYTALYEGSSFTTLDSTKMFHEKEDNLDKKRNEEILTIASYSLPPCTLLFVLPDQLQYLVSAVSGMAEKSFLHSLAWRHKVATMANGFLTKDSLWDRLIFNEAREKIIGESASTLRGVIVTGGLLSSQVVPARVNLSVPVINAYIHPAVCGPVMASHALDVQNFPCSGAEERAHVGPPSVSLEVKVVGVNDNEVEAGGNPEGNLLVRGPPVCGRDELTKSGDEESWVPTGVRAQVATNGTFRIF
jgi:long-chain acyl-CoA synthetase